MKIKVSEATGIVLDWMVAKCEGIAVCEPIAGIDQRIEIRDPYTGTYSYDFYTPSKDWAQGGPIIERERVATNFSVKRNCWFAENFMETDAESGTTPLEAAMRCYVASNLGDEVEVPDEIV